MRDEKAVPDGDRAAIPSERAQGNDGEAGPTAPGSQPEVLQAVHVETVDGTPVIAAPESILEEVRRRLASLPSTELRPLVVTTQLYLELCRLKCYLRRNGRIVYREPWDRRSGWGVRFHAQKYGPEFLYDLPVVDADQARVAELIVRNWRPRRRRRRARPRAQVHIHMPK